MSDIADAAKRLLLGRPVRSDKAGPAPLPKRVALPVLGSNGLSSVAYAPDEILLTLAVGGLAATTVSGWVGLAVVVVLLTVVMAYRQNVRAYPSGGDYRVATTNLGPTAGVAAASALMVDYVLTVAVSLSAGAQYLASAVPAVRGHETLVALVLLAVLAVANLRGVRESSLALTLGAYLFMLAVGTTAVVGFVRHVTGTLGESASAGLDLVVSAGSSASADIDQGIVGLAGVLLVARAFASGCAALTGVEAVSNRVQVFRAPRARNAATTLAVLGGITAVMMLVILWLARVTGVRYVEDPATQLAAGGGPPPADYVQHPVLGQLAETVFRGVPAVFVVVVAVTAVILLLAANSAFTAFPVLGSILAKDGYLPRQMHTRGDRLAFSNGILTLAVAAGVLVWVFDAEVSRLIQVYIVGVFVSFLLSQLGMVRHWNRALRTEPSPRERRRMRRARVLNGVGLAMTASVLVIVLVTRFTHGAWIAVVAMGAAFALMHGVRTHYDRVGEELAIGDDLDAARALPSRVHAIVLVSHLHRPTLRALAYARASRPSVLEAVTVGVDPEEVATLTRQWEELDLPVTLRVLDSPYREITRPVLSYVRSVRRESPRDLVVVYVPEYVVGRWWEHLLHNQSALRIRTRLLFTPGVVVASVPWQLSSSQGGA